MRAISKLLLGLGILSLGHQAHAFTQDTHRQIVIDAVNYMKANPNTTNFAKLQAAANAAGYTAEQVGQMIGQGAYDVDDFEDTFLCGAITGDCVDAPVFGIGSFVATYTAWWHFQNHSQGQDAHGNDLGGYNNSLIPVYDTLIDGGLKTWLINDHLDDGPGGMTGTCFWAFGWRCAEDSEFNSYGVTERNYRLDSYSTPGMYEDFQNTPYQPIDNLGQYWYNEFLKSPTFQTLGFSLHTTDLLQPHHVWVTSGKNHGGWEGWVQDNYFSENLNDFSRVDAAMSYYTPVSPNNPDIRSLFTAGGAFAYQVGGAVLHTTNHGTRVNVGQQVIPHAIAMVVHVLNHAAEQFAATDPADTYRALKDGKSGLCMDVAGGSSANGTNVRLWTCNGSNAQKWKYDASTGHLRSAVGKCLDNRGQAYNGGEIVIWDCVNHNNLKFDWVGTSLRNRHNNNIAVDAFGTGQGANIGQWSYHGGPNQQWYWQ